jgi:CRP-like cAMP-binding protein
MFDDELRSATVEAIDDIDALVVFGEDMRRLMREHAEIAVKLAISLVRRLRRTNERLARQSFLTVQSRVAAVLAQLVDQARGEDAGARHAGRFGQARRLFTRIGESVPRGARACGRDLPGPRTADRPRSGGARGLCLLTTARRPMAGWSSVAPRCW